MRVGMTVATLAIAAVGGLGSMNAALAFKIGDKAEGEEIRAEMSKSPARGVLAKFLQGGLNFSDAIRLGDPIHEDMVRASFDLAANRGAAMQCKVSREAVEAFKAPPNDAKVTSEVCCARGADSDVCNWLDKSWRHKSFVHPSPHVTGVRWNDDPCHMTISKERGPSRPGWAAWMLDFSPSWGNNMNYASHFHEKGFLHAMASIGQNESAYREDAKSTQAKIRAWSEFAFRVADGSMPVTTTLRDAAAKLGSPGGSYFRQAFHSSLRHTIAWLFTGRDDADERHVRQVALAALMHTVQDAFSASHVTRENADPDEREPRLAGVGKVKRFLLYRPQVGAKHGEADRRPSDWNSSAVGAFHPVPLGAELVACAAAAQPGASTWSEASAVIERTIELGAGVSNPATSGGGRRFETQEPATIQ